jgi:23S rRNA (guanosine2251-2'-O)-methyltransferase
VRALKALEARGYWAAGLVPRGGVDLYDWEASQPLVIVVGGEAGVRRLVAEECDTLVSIPMIGTTESLNAAVAAAVVVFELLRRWRTA